jgi:hypothetical protein
MPKSREIAVQGLLAQAFCYKYPPLMIQAPLRKPLILQDSCFASHFPDVASMRGERFGLDC